MLLSKNKVKELEFLASELQVHPDALLDILFSLGFKEKKEKQICEIRIRSPEEKVKSIEEEALSKGWTYEQLWCIPPHRRYDQMGLICLVDNTTTIGEVTEKHISLIHEKPVGEPVILNFYNNKVDQPWIKRKGDKNGK